jgi:chemotaxis protein methyltransferase CheR
MPVTQLSDVDFARIQEIIYVRTGMRFDDSRRAYVEKRVLDRIAATDEDDAMQYLARLRFERSGAELQALVNALTVNETYFFREDYQLDCLTSSLLPELAREPRRTLRIWSLPCSTGEEPYTIAIQLLERFARIDDYNVEIVGSDIDTQVLAAAMRGIYPDRSVQYVPPAWLKKYFQRHGDSEWQICSDLRGSVEFNQTSIVDRLQVMRNQRFDVVFCRNLLIYFDEISRRLAAENIFEALHPGGFVCLGHSESMSRISSSFAVRKFPEAIVYQRPKV